jgi:hypothetical protein
MFCCACCIYFSCFPLFSTSSSYYENFSQLLPSSFSTNSLCISKHFKSKRHRLFVCVNTGEVLCFHCKRFVYSFPLINSNINNSLQNNKNVKSKANLHSYLSSSSFSSLSYYNLPFLFQNSSFLFKSLSTFSLFTNLGLFSFKSKICNFFVCAYFLSNFRKNILF